MRKLCIGLVVAVWICGIGALAQTGPRSTESQPEDKGAMKMLYLVNCDLKGSYPLAAEEWLNIVLKGMETIQDYKKQGKVVIHCGLVGQQAGVMIWNVNSNEELHALLSQLPFWPFMEWTITPLLSTEQTIASVKEALAKIR